MSSPLTALLDRFVLPLLAGGSAVVGGPIRPKLQQRLVLDVAPRGHAGWLEARDRLASLWIPNPDLPLPDEDEVSLWIGIYNLLALEHPERGRAWSRAVAWQRAEAATQTSLSLRVPDDLGTALARHVAVESLLVAQRADAVVAGPDGDVRFPGRPAPRSRVRGLASVQHELRHEYVLWRAQPRTAQSRRLVPSLYAASPLTALVRAGEAPPDLDPMLGVPYLEIRPLARAICNRWSSESDWLGVGAQLVAGVRRVLFPRESLESSADTSKDADAPQVLALPGPEVDHSPAAVATLLSALTHLHFLKLLDGDVRLGEALGGRASAVRDFLALPVALRSLGWPTGRPVAGASDLERTLEVRWDGYVEHLADLVPRAAVERLTPLVRHAANRPGDGDRAEISGARVARGA